MRFLFAKIGFTMLAAAFAASFLEKTLCAGTALLLLLLGTICAVALKKAKTLAVCLFSAAAGFILIFANLSVSYYPAKSLGGLRADIEGTVTEISAGNGKAVYTVETSSVSLENAPQKLKVKLSGFGEYDLSEYDKISCNALFYASSGGYLTERLYDRSGGVSLYAFIDAEPEITGKESGTLRCAISALREKISAIVDEFYSGDGAALMKQMLIGERGETSSVITDSFRRAGISHIVVISGVHLMIVMSIVGKLLAFWRKRALKSALMIAVIVIYMLVAGCGFSVLRAGFTYIMFILTKLILVQAERLESLGVAIAVIIFINPLACCDIGFLLSVFASAGIILIKDPIEAGIYRRLPRLWGKTPRYVREAFVISCAAYVFVLPVTMLAFDGVSALAPVTNVFTAFFASEVLTFGFLSVALGAVPFLGIFAAFAAFIAQLFEYLLLAAARLFAAIPFAYIDMDYEWAAAWVFGSLLLFALPAAVKRSAKYVKYSAVFSAFLLVFGILAREALFAGTLSTEVIPLCNGTAVRCSNGSSSVLITEGLSGDDYYRLGLSCKKAEVLVSLNAESAPAEFLAAKNLSAKTAVFTYEDSAERYEGAATAESGTVTFWDGAEINIVNSEVFAVDMGEISILYISENCDIMEIAPRLRKAQIVILSGAAPKEYPELRPEYTLLCGGSVPFGTEEKVIILGEKEVNFRTRGENIRKG